MERTERLIQILNFLVEATLRGHARCLKETTIGVSVFGRSPDYVPKIDTIVRGRECRLRAKLRRYCATEGAQNSVIIEIPKGQYAAAFALRPRVLVEPLGDFVRVRLP
jgi:hypothetical protein